MVAERARRHKMLIWWKAKATRLSSSTKAPVFRAFVIGVLFLGVGILWEWFSQPDHSQTSDQPVAPQLLSKLLSATGEAIIVAAVIAVTVEGRLRKIFTESLVEQAMEAQDAAISGLLWQLTYRHAPKAYLGAIKELAYQVLYTTHAHYELNFSYVNERRDAVKLTISHTSEIQNRGDKPVLVPASGWLVSSIDGQSAWLKSVYECNDQDFRVDYVGEGLADTRPMPNGYASFVAKDDAPILHLAAGGLARIALVGEVHRNITSSLPLRNKRPVLKTSLSIGGPAAKDLHLSIFTHGMPAEARGKENPLTFAGSDAACRKIDLDGIFLLGQTIEIMWWRDVRTGWLGRASLPGR